MSIVFWNSPAWSAYRGVPCRIAKQAGVRGREAVVVDLPDAGPVAVLRPEVLARQERHVARGAVLLGLGRVVEAPHAVARDAAEQIGVVVVLAAEELLVVVQLLRQGDLVARRAELRGLVERLEERLLVEVRLGLHELLVDPLQGGALARGERVVRRLLQGVPAVAEGAVDVGHGVADGAGDAGVGRLVVDVVEVRVVERPAQERDRVVAPGTPPRRLHVPVAGLRDLAGSRGR